MNVGTDTKLIGVALLGAAAVLYFGYRKASRTVDELVDSAKQTVAGATAAVQSAWANNVQQPMDDANAYAQGAKWHPETRGPREPTEKERLYSDAAYSGNDPISGLPVAAGEWYSNPDALRYENEQRERGALPAYTCTNGAAFGVFPNVGMMVSDRNDLALIRQRGRIAGGR